MTQDGAGPLGPFARGVLVGNEFASVEISVDTAGRVPRLVLRDVTSGRARHIDPLVLEALVHMSDETMRSLADPNLIVSD
ncbi:hypothetical protein I6A60_33535 [Frankia sp. AgB1.9]|uniref:hypothetical protein n=1 Tax=unclassified Frankia TaxID=2632575 RepID=UPI001932DF63|nr:MULTISPECIES: hypothetical protein [unclassified Frankia]MBL7493516.1 hypothetical protein [Frankia sp. AgW1.1]MBL7552743.1 hypothetical protein [Frankia sp. AgB1.9]MBL7624650.1 hypothetical protein [Frankia sp. AgB1.8]